jgi:hypothetical protein
MKTALCLASFLLLFCASAQAQEGDSMEQRKLEFGNVVVCDTQQQMEHYVALYHGDTEAAVHAVNRTENDPTACGIVSAVFVRGPQVGTVRTENMAFEIAHILLLGVDSEDGFRPVQPSPYFTAFGVTEYHA